MVSNNNSLIYKHVISGRGDPYLRRPVCRSRLRRGSAAVHSPLLGAAPGPAGAAAAILLPRGGRGGNHGRARCVGGQKEEAIAERRSPHPCVAVLFYGEVTTLARASEPGTPQSGWRGRLLYPTRSRLLYSSSLN
jgi:hypothetical protein